MTPDREGGSAWWLQSLPEFLRRFRNPLVLILVAASIVSAVTGEVASFLIIVVMVLMSVTLDFAQEYRAAERSRAPGSRGDSQSLLPRKPGAGRRTFANIRKYIMMGTSSSFGNMFSMAAASVFLPFLPMLPAQILLNNVLYDLSEVAIPLDRVDAEETRRPQAWDMTFIRNFMWVIGPVSSLFDFRTRRSPLSSRPHAALAATSLAVVLMALILPFTGVGRYFGFQPPPAEFWWILAGFVVAYLGIVETAKRLFYRYLTSKPR